MKKYCKGVLIVLIFLFCCGCSNSKKVRQQIPNVSNSPLENNFKEVKKFKETVNCITFSCDTEAVQQIGLIGFNDEKFYFTYDDNKNWIYAIATKENKKIRKFYELPISFDINFEKVYQDSLLLGAATWEDESICNYKLYRIFDNGRKELIYECVDRGFPIVDIIDNYMVISTSKQEDGYCLSKVSSYNLDTGERKEITSSKYSTMDSNIYNGSFTMSIGGWKDGFCYDITKLHNESITDPYAGDSTIYYYSFDTQKSIELCHYPYKPFYLCGTEKCFVISNYILEDFANIGSITVENSNKYQTYDVPGFVVGNDVSGSYNLNDKYVIIYSNTNYVIYNLDEKTYVNHIYNDLKSEEVEEQRILDIQCFERKYAYLQDTKDKIELSIHELP